MPPNARHTSSQTSTAAAGAPSRAAVGAGTGPPSRLAATDAARRAWDVAIGATSRDGIVGAAAPRRRQAPPRARTATTTPSGSSRMTRISASATTARPRTAVSPPVKA